jgi:hypothetical protein
MIMTIILLYIYQIVTNKCSNTGITDLDWVFLAGGCCWIFLTVHMFSFTRRTHLLTVSAYFCSRFLILALYFASIGVVLSCIPQHGQRRLHDKGKFHIFCNIFCLPDNVTYLLLSLNIFSHTYFDKPFGYRSRQQVMQL